MTIDPQLKPFIEKLDQLWPEPTLSLSVDAWRGRIEELSRAARVPYPETLSVEDHVLAAGARRFRVRVYRPQADSTLPALLYMHGGGWVVGSIESHDAITSGLATDTPCVVISVDYSRAPEHPFPAAVEDCQAALVWAFDNAAQLGIDPQTIFVGGDSAGGNLAAAMTLSFRRGPRRICGQLLLYPCVDVDFSRASYISEARAPYLKAAEMIWFWEQYCPQAELRRNPLAVPFIEQSLAGLPPAFVVVAEHDPLHDEGRDYVNKLSTAGVPATYRPGKGLIHGFLRTRGICDAAQAEHIAMTAWMRSVAEAVHAGRLAASATTESQRVR